MIFLFYTEHLFDACQGLYADVEAATILYYFLREMIDYERRHKRIWFLHTGSDA